MKRFFFLCLLLFVCGRAFAGPLVSLSVKKAPTEEVFRSLASMSGKNIVFPEALTGELSLTLHDVPYEEALRLAAASQGLFLETVGGRHHRSSGRDHGKRVRCTHSLPSFLRSSKGSG